MLKKKVQKRGKDTSEEGVKDKAREKRKRKVLVKRVQ